MSSPVAVGRSILSVIGPHSGCGKTLFVTQLARHVPGLGCLKVRPFHGHLGRDRNSEQTGEDDSLPQDSRSALGPSPVYALEPSSALSDPGADTALYLAAGAVQVEILRHRGGALAAGLVAALDRFPRGVSVVVESSSAVEFLDPVAVVLIVRPPLREMKPSTNAILSRVTDLLINASDQDGVAAQSSKRLHGDYPSLRPQHTWFADLMCEPPPDQMLARLQVLLTRGAGGGRGSVSD